jgi:uncharacterized membrane protein YozB (DUF420 family)
MLYSIVLTLHSILRWLVILTALFAIIRASTGLSFRRGWMGMDNRAGVLYTSVLDVQVLVGIILYLFLSPITTKALQNFSSVAGNPVALFFTVEHVILMVVAVVVAHVGRSLVRRAPRPVQKHRRAAIWTGLSLLIILIAIPWPFLIYGRPLI